MKKYTFFLNGPFSQWYYSPFTIDDVTYTSAEKYMMAKKALVFKDIETYLKIMATDNPKEQKQYGREVKNFNPEIWNSVCKKHVYDANYAKFTQNKKLYTELMATSGTILVEASPTDKIWGCGLVESDPNINDEKNWTGTNWLGEILTNLREDLFLSIKNN